MQALFTGGCAELLSITIMLVGIVNVFRFRPFIGLFGYTWVAATLILLAFTPSSIHRNYLVDGGFAILLAAGLTTWSRGIVAIAHRTAISVER